MNFRVSAILLAAGRSQRMGRLKQLLPIGEKTVIRRCLDTIIQSGISDIIVVLNPLSAEIREEVRGLPVSIVFNNEPSSEMAESARIGLGKVAGSSTGILIYPSDYPLVTTETVKALNAWHEKEPGRILIPSHKGMSGHPCLFPRFCADEVFKGFTLREIVRNDKWEKRFVEVQDNGILFDMDTEEDYRMIVERYRVRL